MHVPADRLLASAYPRPVCQPRTTADDLRCSTLPELLPGVQAHHPGEPAPAPAVMHSPRPAPAPASAGIPPARVPGRPAAYRARRLLGSPAHPAEVFPPCIRLRISLRSSPVARVQGTFSPSMFSHMQKVRFTAWPFSKRPVLRRPVVRAPGNHGSAPFCQNPRPAPRWSPGVFLRRPPAAAARRDVSRCRERRRQRGGKPMTSP